MDNMTEQQRERLAQAIQEEEEAEKRARNYTRRFMGSSMPRVSPRQHAEGKKNPTRRCACGSGEQFWRCCRGSRVELHR